MPETPPETAAKNKPPFLNDKAKTRAANLRANLARRKEQMRSREEPITPDFDS